MPFSNPRYHILRTLRKRVGQQLGWPLPVGEIYLGGVYLDRLTQQKGRESLSSATSENCQQHSEDQDFGLDAALDDFLTGDPMDLLQWDEWESVSAGMFTN